jgi:hypothetical protein
MAQKRAETLFLNVTAIGAKRINDNFKFQNGMEINI